MTLVVVAAIPVSPRPSILGLSTIIILIESASRDSTEHQRQHVWGVLCVPQTSTSLMMDRMSVVTSKGSTTGKCQKHHLQSIAFMIKMALSSSSIEAEAMFVAKHNIASNHATKLLMFPDSEIAQHFSCSRTKSTVIVNPHFLTKPKQHD